MQMPTPSLPYTGINLDPMNRTFRTYHNSLALLYDIYSLPIFGPIQEVTDKIYLIINIVDKFFLRNHLLEHNSNKFNTIYKYKQYHHVCMLTD